METENIKLDLIPYDELLKVSVENEVKAKALEFENIKLQSRVQVLERAIQNAIKYFDVQITALNNLENKEDK